MRLGLAFFASLLLSIVAAGIVDPAVRSRHVARVDGEHKRTEDKSQHSDLWKRRGGGGGGGRGGGGGGSKGGSGGSSGGGSGGKGGSQSSGKGYNTKSDSNVGGYSRGGTGPQPNYAGGYYAGGSRAPFTAGGASPNGIPARGPLSGAPLAFWPGPWPAPVYMYGPYGYHHNYHNKTSDKDEEREIICGCAKHSECMCDEVDDKKFWDDLIGDGDYKKLNKSVVDVSKVNGTTTILINGTLPNGTTAHSDDPEDYEKYLTNAAAAVGKALGLWPAVAAVMGAVYLL